MAKLVLIDGNSVAYRAFYAMHHQLENFVNGAGLHTNAIYSFKRMLDSILEQENPTHVLVAFDAGKTTFRHDFFTGYKEGRAKTPGEFKEQLPYIRELVTDYGIKYYELPNYEADDIIGTMAHQASQKNIEVVIYSGDRDLTQLTSEHVTVKVTLKGVSEVETYTPTYVEEKYGLEPLQIIDLKGLAGDKSDNIPGVTKVGEKTALKLLHQFGSVEGVYEHIDELKASKMKENLINDEKQAYMSKKLATINQETPVTLELTDLKWQGPDEEKLRKLYQELNFNQFLSQMTTNEEAKMEEIDYQLVQTLPEEIKGQKTAVIIETLSDSYHTDDIIGMALGTEDKIYVVEDVSAFLGEPAVKEWLASDAPKILYDVKKDLVLLHRYDCALSEQNNDDALIGMYLLNTLSSHTDLADIAENFGITQVQHDETVYGKGAKRAVPDDDVLHAHLAHKVVALYRVMANIQVQLKEKEQWSLYTDIEMPMAYVLAHMEIQGVHVDSRILQELGRDLDARIATLADKIYEQAGEEFNINSPKKLGEILFEKLELPAGKKTKTGYSTSMDVLNKLRPIAPIVDDILNYRQLTKLKSTYIDGLLKQIHADGKIHTRYQQTLTQTGRLSSVEPNLQNIPVRLEEGRLIRKAFLPERDDWLMFSSDYSQIELRVLAAVSGDQALQQAFIDGEDIHDSTARRIFHLAPDDEVTSDMRRKAKAVNFGVVYGISDYGLSENLGISRKEAAEFIQTYLEHYPGVKAYMDNVVREAKENGYVETLFHRRRYLRDINSRNYNARSFAERTAINSPIQGSAADILKIAMIDMEKRLAETDIKANLLLQVHDEVIFEVAQSDVTALQQLVEETMEHAVELAVPLITDSHYGPSWYEAK